MINKKNIFALLGLSLSLPLTATINSCYKEQKREIDVKNIMIDLENEKNIFKTTLGQKIEPAQNFIPLNPIIPSNFALYSLNEKDWFESLDLLGNSSSDNKFLFIKFNDRLSQFNIVNNRVIKKEIYDDASKISTTDIKAFWKTGEGYRIEGQWKPEITSNWVIEYSSGDDPKTQEMLWKDSIDKLEDKEKYIGSLPTIYIRFSSKNFNKTYNNIKQKICKEEN